MTAGSTAYEVDLDALLALVDRMAACEADLHHAAQRVRGRVAALHATWDGTAADAHTAAQLEWERGLDAMRDGLAAMRAAATTAHDNYSAAAATNTRMWQAVG
ncbi:WXG100 family type VII secretion target [Nocardioides sp. GCM10027113]|uniref:WXG100 family type VII secretion target n=1 Tax=unclassified Nocardioides TaxID=2615069 RepID=UPI003616AB3B